MKGDKLQEGRLPEGEDDSAVLLSLWYSLMLERGVWK